MAFKKKHRELKPERGDVRYADAAMSSETRMPYSRTIQALVNRHMDGGREQGHMVAKIAETARRSGF